MMRERLYQGARADLKSEDLIEPGRSLWLEVGAGDQRLYDLMIVTQSLDKEVSLNEMGYLGSKATGP